MGQVKMHEWNMRDWNIWVQTCMSGKCVNTASAFSTCDSNRTESSFYYTAVWHEVSCYILFDQNVRVNGNINKNDTGYSKQTLESPALAHWGTCPLDFRQFNFFS